MDKGRTDVTRTHERDIEAVEQRCCGDAWGTELPLASQCGCNQQQIPLLYDTLVGIRTLMRETNRHLEYLVIVADELKELKDEQMNALRSCDCCHLHGTPECGHHDETRSAEPPPAEAGSHEHSMACFQEPGHCPDEVKRPPRRLKRFNDPRSEGGAAGGAGTRKPFTDESRILNDCGHRCSNYPGDPSACCDADEVCQCDYHNPKPPSAVGSASENVHQVVKDTESSEQEGGLCTLCNDGGWKGETHFERSGKHIKASP